MYLYLLLVYLGASMNILCVWDAQSFRVPPGTRLCLTSAAKKYVNRPHSNSFPKPCHFRPATPRRCPYTQRPVPLGDMLWMYHSTFPSAADSDHLRAIAPLILTHPRLPRIAVDRARTRYISLRLMLSRHGAGCCGIEARWKQERGAAIELAGEHQRMKSGAPAPQSRFW